MLVESRADVAARNRCLTFALPPCSALTLRCSDGKTALDSAIDKNKPAVVEYLRSVGAPE